jgi:hypothetical protein
LAIHLYIRSNSSGNNHYWRYGIELVLQTTTRTLQREEAVELKPLLERIWYDAIKQGDDPDFASEIAQMLIALDGYIHRRIELVEYVP